MHADNERRCVPRYDERDAPIGASAECAALTRLAILFLLLFAGAASATGDAKAADLRIRGTIEAPTEYADGRSLCADDLSHYQLAIAIEEEVVGGETEIPIHDASISRQFEIPGGRTVCLMARVIDAQGRSSEWTEPRCRRAPGTAGRSSLVDLDLFLPPAKEDTTP